MTTYLKNLHNRLISIYNLTSKGIPFEWKEEHQNTFEEIKNNLSNPLGSVMPNNKGHFTLVSDSRGVACGAILYKKQS